MSRKLSFLCSIMCVGLVTGFMLQSAHATKTDQPGLMQWKFKVFLDEKEIGFHDYRVVADGNTRRVETEASFDVRFLFFNAFSYRHKNVETWDENCLTGINASTRTNGKELSVRGRSDTQQFIVSSTQGEQELPACIMSFAYWNPAMVDASQLLNAQTGKLEDVQVVAKAETTVDVAGEAVRAKAFDLVLGDSVITVWYGLQDSRWLALEAPARGGRTIRYAPLHVPELTPRLSALADGDANDEG